MKRILLICLTFLSLTIYADDQSTSSWSQSLSTAIDKDKSSISQSASSTVDSEKTSITQQMTNNPFATSTNYGITKTEYTAPLSFMPQLIVGGQFGSEQSGNLDAMLPFGTTNGSLYFADLRANKSTDNTFNASVGLGYRSVLGDSAILGLSGFYDFSDSQNYKYFSQVSGGMDVLTTMWDFRLNGYFPIGRNNQLLSSVAAPYQQIGHELWAENMDLYEVAKRGGDFEMGHYIWGGDTHTMRLYGGVYYFAPGQGTARMLGYRARVEQWITSYLAVNGTYQHDDVRGNQYYLGVKFRFGGVSVETNNDLNNSEWLRQRLMEPVQREEDVVLNQRRDFSPVYQLPYLVDYVKAGSVDGDGTFEHPYNSVDEAMQDMQGKSNGIVYIDGNNNAQYTMSNGTQLTDGESIYGSGSDFIVNGVDFTRATIAPMVTIANTTPNEPGLLMGNNTSISGINFVGDSSVKNIDAIYATNVTNVQLANLNFNGFSNAIELNNGVINTTLNNVSATNSMNGLLITGATTANIVVTNSTFNSNVDNGVEINNGAQNITLNNITANGSTNGLLIDDPIKTNIAVSNSNFNSNTSDGISITDGSMYINLQNIIATNNQLNGVSCISCANLIVFGNNQFNNNKNNGISLSNVSNVSLDGITANANQQNGISIDGISNDVTIGANSAITANANKLNGLVVYDDLGKTSNIDVLSGNYNNNVGSGIMFYGHYQWYSLSNSMIANVTVNHNGQGITIGQGATNITLSNVTADYNTGTGLSILNKDIADSFNIIVKNSSFNNNASDGILISGDFSYTPENGIEPIQFLNVVANGNTGDGLHVHEDIGNSFAITSHPSLILNDFTANNNGKNGFEMENGILPFDSVGISRYALTVNNSSFIDNTLNGISFMDHNGSQTFSTAPNQFITDTQLRGNGDAQLIGSGCNIQLNEQADQLQGLAINANSGLGVSSIPTVIRVTVDGVETDLGNNQQHSFN